MPSPKANILVAFYSRDGSVEALAKAVSEGAREAGAEVRLRRVPDLVSTDVMAKVPGWEERSKRMLAEYGAPTHADVEWADGIIFGTPTRFGNTSAELKAFIDSLGGLWFQGKLNGKAAGAFTSTAGPHGGNETTVVSLFIPMAHLGFIIVPNGYGRNPCEANRAYSSKSRCAGRAQTVSVSNVFRRLGVTLNEEQIPQVVGNNKNQGVR